MPTELNERRRVPAVEGWFTDGDQPRLIGGRCASCGTVVFPRRQEWCPNPDCENTELDTYELSTRGRVWSYCENRYAPPPPFVASDPFVPYAIAAVELAEEKLVILGQVVDGVGAADLRVGMEMELVVATLDSTDGTDGTDPVDHVIYKWAPVAQQGDRS